MSNYDLRLSDAKYAMTQTIIKLNGNNLQTKKPYCDPDLAMRVAQQVDSLNDAWDKLTDALLRQRKMLEEKVCQLIRELAEANKSI